MRRRKRASRPWLYVPQLFGATALVASPASTAFAADPVHHGKEVFQTCAACHSDKPNAIGPSLRGV